MRERQSVFFFLQCVGAGGLVFNIFLLTGSFIPGGVYHCFTVFFSAFMGSVFKGSQKTLS